ncbi:hypothetical protein WMY93_029961 [Mugilogobius chulae]|uniref:Uncharacterized protein n=1 Tax=Mugilogobius chulae TaxID=88201 RepID=A0AAW0MLB6_9GOBI
MREDAEDIMRDILQENGRLEFELTEARRETEAIERQQLQETTELEEAKDETQTMRESLCNAQETIAELELNRSHLEIHSENQEQREALQALLEDRENVIRKIEMEDERRRSLLEECQRRSNHNLELLDEEKKKNEVLTEELSKERARKRRL